MASEVQDRSMPGATHLLPQHQRDYNYRLTESNNAEYASLAGKPACQDSTGASVDAPVAHVMLRAGLRTVTADA